MRLLNTAGLSPPQPRQVCCSSHSISSRRRSRLPSLPPSFLCSHAATIVAVIVGSAVFAGEDVALVIAAQANINSLLSNASFCAKFGNRVRGILAVMILMWATEVVPPARACYCRGVRQCVFER